MPTFERQVTFRLSEADYVKLQTMAAMQKRPMANLIRLMIESQLHQEAGIE